MILEAAPAAAGVAVGIWLAATVVRKSRRTNGRPDVGDSISFADAISYAADNKPSDERVAKGALLLRRTPKSVTLSWVYLDTGNEVLKDTAGKPYGRTMTATGIDSELSEAFGDSDMLLLE